MPALYKLSSWRTLSLSHLLQLDVRLFMTNATDRERLESATASETAPPEEPSLTLTLKQAAAVLGKSLRALERSLIGKWGNRLPDGWTARRVATASGYEWRICPPPGFKLRQLATDKAGGAPEIEESEQTGLSLSGSARQLWGFQDEDGLSTVVIDRTDEIERLLRRLVEVQMELNEERRQHLEDLRLLAELQGSIRLVEAKAAETSELKKDLALVRGEFTDLKARYQELANLPFWKRLFFRSR